MAERARVGVRMGAAAIDCVLAGVLTFLLGTSTGMYFARRAVIAFEVGSPGTIWKGPVPFALGLVSPISYGFAFAALLVLLTEPLFGASPGKLLLRARIVDQYGSQPLARQAWLRFAVKTSGLWLFCVALVAGRWELVIVAAIMACAVFMSCVLYTTGNVSTMHDRVAATYVGRR